MMNRLFKTLLIMLAALAPAPLVAQQLMTERFGEAEVVYGYQPLKAGAATLTLTAIVNENNDALRGLRNSDQRRLSRLGQLIYQCKLLVNKPKQTDTVISSKDPILLSRNYSLVTGVDLALSEQDSVAVEIHVIPQIKDKRLFGRSMGGSHGSEVLETRVGQGRSLNMRRIDLDVLDESGLMASAESVDISVRFPAFQLQRPVHQWRYSFNMRDFGRAVQYADANCTIERLMELANEPG